GMFLRRGRSGTSELGARNGKVPFGESRLLRNPIDACRPGKLSLDSCSRNEPAGALRTTLDSGISILLLLVSGRQNLRDQLAIEWGGRPSHANPTPPLHPSVL